MMNQKSAQSHRPFTSCPSPGATKESAVGIVMLDIDCCLLFFSLKEYLYSDEYWWECHRDHKYCFHLSLLFAYILVVVLHSQVSGVEDDECRGYYK